MYDVVDLLRNENIVCIVVHLICKLGMQDLYDLGARRIAVFSVIPVGCVPLQRTVGGGIRRKCANCTNSAAELFNSKLSAEIDALPSRLPNSTVAYIDWYTPVIDVIQNPKKYG